MLVWFICLEILRKGEGERVWEFTSGLQGQARKEEKPVQREQHLSALSIYFKFDPFQTASYPGLAQEPRREVPSVILSLEHLPSPKSK